MNKKAFILILALFIFFTDNKIDAQTTVGCYGDTIVLKLAGYSDGNLQWEQSSDSVDWFEINGAVNDTLLLGPLYHNSAYYRVKVTNSNCQFYSFVSKVIIEVANAGCDRSINGDSLKLEANTPVYGSGSWSIISGGGGHYYNHSLSNTVFKGIQDSTYILRWTITNTCGTTYDDVEISFHRLIIKNNIVVIDTVNEMLSDSTELSQGIYRVLFHDSIPEITDSSFIIGYTNDGYLRKVNEVYIVGNTVTMVTETANMDDIFESGVMNMLLNLSNIDSTGNKSKSPSDNLKLLWERVNYLAPGISLNNATKSNLGSGFRFNFNDLTIYQSGPFAISIPTGYVKFEPNFVCDFEYDNGLQKLYLYADNALLETSADIELSCSQQFNLVDSKTTLASYDKCWAFMAGWVPVIIVLNIDLVAKLNVDVGASMTATTGFTHTDLLSLGIKYDNNTWQNVFSHDSHNNFDPLTFNSQLNMSQRLEIVPEVKVKIYGVAGPYISPILYEELNGICNLTSGNWNKELKAGFDAEIGAEVSIFGETLANYHKTFTGPSASLITPYLVERISGHNQQGTVNQPLPAPVKVKISDNLGHARQNVKVYFVVVTGGGSITPFVITDQYGYAQATWTMGSTVGTQTLKASVRNADGTEVHGSPAYFSATTSSLCSTFQVHASAAGDSIVAFATGGLAPYLYSLDGITYTANSIFHGVTAGQHPVFSKDANDCSGVVLVVVNDICQTNSLSVNTAISGNNLTVYASGGTSPYMYSINNTNYFSSNFFAGLSQGDYIAYVKDANDCIATTLVTIINTNATSTLALTATANSSSITASATGGTPLYCYSLNGTNYQPNNIFLNLSPGNYTVFVKDYVNCVKSANATITNPSCISSSLSLSAAVNGNNVTLTATSGTPPYAYSMNGSTYSNNNHFDNNPNGSYTFYVKDATACTYSIQQQITSGNNPPATPGNYSPVNGAINIPLTALRTWSCSNPSNDTLRYHYYFGTTNPPPYLGYTNWPDPMVQNNGTLLPSTTYYWKVVVTNSQGLSSASPVLSFTTALHPNLAIGDSYGGGKVAYIFQPGDQGYVSGEIGGIIAAPYDQSTGIVWCNGTNISSGATNSVLGTGNLNTNMIVAKYGVGNYAAQLCNDLVLAGYDDWYLPSIDELTKLFLNRVAIGGFSAMEYWSSTDMPDPNLNAYSYHFLYQSVYSRRRNEGSINTHVRAIRTFPTVKTPSLMTIPINLITDSSATCGGTIVSDGGYSIISKGVCWSPSPSPNTSDFLTIDGTGLGGYTSNLTGLNAATLYYVKAYATNNIGTAYGNEFYFITPIDSSQNQPTISLDSLNGDCINGFSAHYTITNDGGTPITAHGICWSWQNSAPTLADFNTTVGTGMGAFNANIPPTTGLYVRAFCTNANGTTYSNALGHFCAE